MTPSLLDQFLAEECTPYVRQLVHHGLEAARSGMGPRRRRFDFNRFAITFDLDQDDVLIEDVLDPTEEGVARVPMADFSAALVQQ